MRWSSAASLCWCSRLIGILAALTGKIDWLWHKQRLDQIVLVTMLDWALFLALSLQQLGDTKAPDGLWLS